MILEIVKVNLSRENINHFKVHKKSKIRGIPLILRSEKCKFVKLSVRFALGAQMTLQGRK